jgi:TonB family protein
MMIVATWVVYCLVLSALLTGGALAWERSAQGARLPVRWGWLVALAGSVSLPWLLRLAPARNFADSLPAGLPVVRLDPVLGAAAAAESGGGLGAVGVAAIAWVVVSVLLGVLLGGLMWRLHRSRSAWRAEEIDGMRVLVSEDVGPAVIGVARSAVVVPAWVLSLDSELRGLLLLHEREHVRAGDPRLLLCGLVLLAVMPWNPFVWLQLARLRNGIELDCDARVLRSGASPRRYGTLLLEVGRRRRSPTLVMATFAEPHMFLRERIRRIAQWPARQRPLRAFALGALALALFATALSARDPLSSARVLPHALPTIALPGFMPADTPPPVQRTPRPLREIEEGPTFTPMTVRPELRNMDEVRRELNREYPPMLRDAGIGGTALVWFLLNDEGDVVRAVISKPSGRAELDSAALRVGRAMRFSPARYHDDRVPVWVEIPIVFGPPPPGTVPASVQPPRPPLPTTPAGAPPAPAPAPVAAGAPVAAPAPAPAPAPATAPATAVTTAAPSPALAPASPSPPAVREGVPVAPPSAVPAAAAPPLRAGAATSVPTLLNPREVESAIMSNYPPLLWDAGIRGTVVLSLLVDARGDVARMQVSRSAGRAELDEAALRVAGVMRFSPPLEQGRPAPVWVEVPVVFGTTVR